MAEELEQIRTDDGIPLEVVIQRPTSTATGCVILAHGITADRDEEGAFVRLANALCDAGMVSIRFDFRGHGSSTVPSIGTTIAGEILDLKAVVDHAGQEFGGLPTAILAASFGAVSTCLLLPYLERRLRCLAMWNPVLDVEATFVKPTTEWGKKNFAGPNVRNVYRDGYFMIDEAFRVGVVLWEELRMARPATALEATSLPVLLVHGDQDTYVPFVASERMANTRRATEFKRIAGADHGFSAPAEERLAVQETVNFLGRHCA